MIGVGHSKSSVYARNVGILKAYTDDEYRLIHMQTMRLAGFEERDKPHGKGKKGSAGNTTKLSQSLSRSRKNVLELAKCNPWEWFVTLTIDGSKHDRYDLKQYQKKLSKWINNRNSSRGCATKYLLIPEPHKDNAWHMHGLLQNIPLDELVPLTLQDNIPQHVKELIASGREIYNWPAYANAFGWVTLERIRDHDRCAAYLTKYITKELMESSIAMEHHTYYSSKGLQRARVIHQGEIRQNFEPDFENDYVRIKQFTTLEEPLKYFCDKEHDNEYTTSFDDSRSCGDSPHQPQ